MNFFEKSLLTLELPDVLRLVSNEACSETAKEKCLELRPSTVQEEVHMLIEETSSACAILSAKGSPSFSGIRDVRASLERARLGGGLNTRELLDIASVLRTSRTVRTHIADEKLAKTAIDYLFNSLKTNKFLEEKITNSISSEEEISDCASADLAEIRKKMRAASARARDSLQKIISSPSYNKSLQENIITMRGGRYVVPVKAECKGSIPGLVHDTSATGATLFIEPMAAVNANNELKELGAKEKLEIERILMELSAECAEFSTDIEADYYVLIKLDVIFAKAKYSYANECIPAGYEEKTVVLNHAYHPLLDRATAVPISVELGKKFDTLVITGPNTGGKTVSLKTIGLLAAMNQCGIHIPAKDGSCLPVFDAILADIGDEQSIEQSLSTFSAHMSNIVSIINDCTGDSLVLFDELGAGTDPAEGAALAVSIIERVRLKGALTAATTHYTELKIYATNEDGVQNASCEFDIETLKPTYKLLIGIPGKSNAFAIASRLGLDESVVSDARNHIGAVNSSLESTIEKLEKTRIELEHEKTEVEKTLASAIEKDRKASDIKAELEKKLEKAEINARREAEEIIRHARETSEDVFAELDEMKKRINEEDDAHRINEARNELRRRLNLAEDSVSRKKAYEDNRKSSRKPNIEDFVEIKSLGLRGIVSSVNSDGSVLLKCGNMNITAKEDDVYILEGLKPQKLNGTSQNSNITLNSKAISSEVDLRGMDSVEAVLTAERFIDDAVMNKLETVSIIHGKGTGVLRSAIHKMLKTNKAVKSFRLGTFGEGESGVTIVNIK